jgi:hypothetical protein
LREVAGALGRNQDQRAAAIGHQAALQQSERVGDHPRVPEGRIRAKARGQHYGRPPKLTPQQQKEARQRRAEGATLKELARTYNVGRSTNFEAWDLIASARRRLSVRRIWWIAESQIGQGPMDWKKMLIDVLPRWVEAFGIPIALVIIVVILKPVFSQLISRATTPFEIKDFKWDEQTGSLNLGSSSDAPLMRVAKEVTARSKDEIEKLRIFLETEQIKQLIVYHHNGLSQSQISFWFSIGAASIGFLVIVVGVISIFSGSQLTTSVVSIGSGAVIDAVAALFFTQSNQARRLMTEFFDKLRTDRQFNESLRLCDAIQDEHTRAGLQVQLSLFFAGLRPDKEEVVRVSGSDATAVPKLRRRGVRQHAEADKLVLPDKDG